MNGIFVSDLNKKIVNWIKLHRCPKKNKTEPATKKPILFFLNIKKTSPNKDNNGNIHINGYSGTNNIIAGTKKIIGKGLEIFLAFSCSVLQKYKWTTDATANNPNNTIVGIYFSIESPR